MRAPARRLFLPRIGVVLCFALMPTWLRFSFDPAVYTDIYINRFLLLSAMLLTTTAWFVCGMPGWARLRDNRPLALMLFCLLALAGWAYISQSWGFAALTQPDAGLNAALSWCVVALFCVVTACAAPPAGWLAAALVTSTALNALLAIAQVEAGGALGIHALGEMRFGAAVDGTSLIRAGDITFVRPYGLLAHPNMLGGVLVVGVLLASDACIHLRRSVFRRRDTAGVRRGAASEPSLPAPRDAARMKDMKRAPLLASASQVLLLLLVALLFYALLLTFSRAAWLGLAAGAVVWLGLMSVRVKPLSQARYLAPLLTVALVVGALFVAQYRPLIGARVGEGTESLELRSVADRLVYTDFALRAVAERPLIGQGAGYFPWRAAAYLDETFFDLRGDHVHQVFLSAWAELGLVGLGLLCLALCLGVEAALRGGRRGLPAGLLASVVALAVIGLFDHYPYSQLPFMALWWCLLVASST